MSEGKVDSLLHLVSTGEMLHAFIAPSLWYVFDPKEDITAYEMARSMPMIVAMSAWSRGHDFAAIYANMGTAQRHWTKVGWDGKPVEG